MRAVLEAYDGFLAMDLQNYYTSQQISADVWVVATEFFGSYLPENQVAFLRHEFSGTESAVATTNGRVIRLIRPTFLPVKE